MKSRSRIFCSCFAVCFALSSLLPVTAGAETEEERAKRIEYAETVVGCVNDARAARGLGELDMVPDLCDVTQIRAVEISEVFSHDRPDGRDFTTTLKENGYSNYSFAAENIAAGNSLPQKTFNQWMNSPGHRDNMLSEDLTHIEIGYYYNPDVKYKYFWGMFLIGVYDEMGMPCVYPTQYKPVRAKGDADGTKVINAADAAYVLTFAAEKAVGNYINASVRFSEAADINNDGKVNAVDASIILAYSAQAGLDPNAAIEDYIW